MKKTIKVRAETLEQARNKFKKEIPEDVFILRIISEFGTYKPIYDTGYFMGDTVEEAIKSAKEKLPDPYFIKGEVVPELEANTNIKVPILIKAESDWQAKYTAESFIENQFFPNAGFGVAKLYYTVINNQLTKRGFKGVFGIGKQEDTYKVTFLIKPKITLKYSFWSHIVAEITDDKDILNGTMIKYAKKQWFDEVKRLIEQGADINFCDKDGRNSLFYSYHDFEISKFFLDKGIDFRKIDKSGDNILTYCLRNDYHVEHKLRDYLEKHKIKEDKTLLKEIRKAKHQAEEDRKKWCPNCQKKVKTTLGNWRTIHGHGDYTVDEVDVNCVLCGTKLGSEISQSW